MLKGEIRIKTQRAGCGSDGIRMEDEYVPIYGRLPYWDQRD